MVDLSPTTATQWQLRRPPLLNPKVVLTLVALALFVLGTMSTLAAEDHVLATLIILWVVAAALSVGVVAGAVLMRAVTRPKKNAAHSV